MVKFLLKHRLVLVILLAATTVALTMLGDWFQIKTTPVSPTAVFSQALENQQHALKEQQQQKADSKATLPSFPGIKLLPPFPTTSGQSAPGQNTSGQATTGNGSGASQGTPSQPDQGTPVQPKGLLQYLQLLGNKLIPTAINLSFGLLVLSVAWLFYGRAKDTLMRFTNKTRASLRGKILVERSFQLAYWGFFTFLAISIMAPDLLAKLLWGVSIVTAAMVFALQKRAADFVAGVAMHLSPDFEVGDKVLFLGKNVTGVVLDIGFLKTKILAEDKGVITLSNNDVADGGNKKVPPPKSSIILP